MFCVYCREHKVLYLFSCCYYFVIQPCHYWSFYCVVPYCIVLIYFFIFVLLLRILTILSSFFSSLCCKYFIIISQYVSLMYRYVSCAFTHNIVNITIFCIFMCFIYFTYVSLCFLPCISVVFCALYCKLFFQ